MDDEILVEFDTFVVPRTIFQIELACVFAYGAFADEIDAGGRVAHTCGHAGRAAYDFDAVIKKGVLRTDKPTAAHEFLVADHAVYLVVFNREAARIKLGFAHAGNAVLQNRNAGRFLQHGIQILQVLILHLLPGEGADALRGFLQLQIQLGGGGAAFDGVVIAAFLRSVALAAHNDFAYPRCFDLRLFGVGAGAEQGGGKDYQVLGFYFGSHRFSLPAVWKGYCFYLLFYIDLFVFCRVGFYNQ